MDISTKVQVFITHYAKIKNLSPFDTSFLILDAINETRKDGAQYLDGWMKTSGVVSKYGDKDLSHYNPSVPSVFCYVACA